MASDVSIHFNRQFSIDKTYTVTRVGIDIAFVLVPGLRAIVDNEEAEKGAKSAAKQTHLRTAQPCRRE